MIISKSLVVFGNPFRQTQKCLRGSHSRMVRLSAILLISVVPVARFTAAANSEDDTVAAASNISGETTVADESQRVIVLQGKVFDPAERPLSGARFYLSLDPWAEPQELGVSDKDGSYRFEVPENVLRAKIGFGTTFSDQRAALIAVAEGWGPAWEELLDVEGGRIGEMRAGYVHDFRLVADFPITGRIVDSSGMPVVGAEVSVSAIHDLSDRRWFKMRPAIERNAPDSLTRAEIDTNNWSTPLYPTAWHVIPPATTDAEGCFHLAGAGSDRAVRLHVDGPGIVAKGYLSVITRDDVAEFTRLTRVKYPGKDGVHLFDPAPWIEVERARTIAGTVRDPRTGEPIPRVRIHATTFTDARGRYRILRGATHGPFAFDADMENDLYLNSTHSFADAGGNDEVVADFEMPRGVVISGRVLEAGTDQPLPSLRRRHCHDIGRGPVIAGRVSYFPLATNAALRGAPAGKYFEKYPSYFSSALIDAEGRFTLGVPPGPGVLLVYANPGMSDMYFTMTSQMEELAKRLPFALLDSRSRNDGAPGDDPKTLPGFAQRVDVTNYHAYRVINPSADEEKVELTIEVPRAPSRTLRFVDPEGRPIEGLSVQGVAEKLPNALLEFSAAKDGSEVEIIGLSPARPRRVVAVSSDGRFIGVNEIHADDPQPRTITLEAAASVEGRLVDAKTARPLANYGVRIVYPSPVQFDPSQLYVAACEQVTTDADGHFRIGRAVPNRPLAVYFWEPPSPAKMGAEEFQPAASQDLVLGPGETRELGDVSISPSVEQEVAASIAD